MFARTKRLLLRPGWSEDAAALQAAIADPTIIRNLARAPWPYEAEDAKAFLTNGWDSAQPNFLIFSRTHGAPKLIGGCGINQEDDGALDLGYWIARPFWGLGFATEAATAVTQIARSMGVDHLTASHFVDNAASGRVLTKLGFRPTGKIVKRYSIGRREEVDSILFEDIGETPMRPDPAIELYEDRAIAA